METQWPPFLQSTQGMRVAEGERMQELNVAYTSALTKLWLIGKQT